MKTIHIIIIGLLLVSCENKNNEVASVSKIVYLDGTLSSGIPRINLAKKFDSLVDSSLWYDNDVRIEVEQSTLEMFHDLIMKSGITGTRTLDDSNSSSFGHIVKINFHDGDSTYYKIQSYKNYKKILVPFFDQLDLKEGERVLSAFANYTTTTSFHPSANNKSEMTNIIIYYRPFFGIVSRKGWREKVTITNGYSDKFHDYLITGHIEIGDSLAKESKSNHLEVYRKIDEKYIKILEECPEIFESCRD